MRDCLRGLRVLDLSQYLPGPYAAQILSDLGAEVFKVEPPGGDPMRHLGPRDCDGLSPYYKLVNAGKTAVGLDLKSEAGRATLGALVAAADALIESFRPGALARLGFGPADLKALNPRLVHCALSGYGQTGPYALKAGHDINYMALGGGLATSGTADGPLGAHPPTADYASGMQAALAVLAALLRRERPGPRQGEGVTLDCSISETVLAWQAIQLTAAQRPGQAPERRRALLNGGAACYQVYETADGRFVTLGALEEKFWAAFCIAAGQSDWVERQWEPLPQATLIDEVAACFRADDLATWNSRLAAVDCCYEPVLDPREVATHPQAAARGLVRARAGAEPYTEVLAPMLFDGAAPVERAPLRQATADEMLRAWRNAGQL